MFAKALSKKAQTALAELGKSGLLEEAYLAGGTAAALQLGHRISLDFDFFVNDDFNALEFVAALRKKVDFDLDQISEGTILGRVYGIKFSLFRYQYKILFPFKAFLGVNLLDLRDIAAMKIVAISERGVKRDFIDLYFICKSGITLAEILKYYDKKYGVLASNLMHIKKSLVYFIDADEQQIPKMLMLCNWQEVKAFFESEVSRIAVKRDSGIKRWKR